MKINPGKPLFCNTKNTRSFTDDDYYTTTEAPTTTMAMPEVDLDGFSVVGNGDDDFEKRLAEFDQPKVQVPSPSVDNRIGGD